MTSFRFLLAVFLFALLAISWCAYDDQVQWAAFVHDHHCRAVQAPPFDAGRWVFDGGQIVRR